MSQHKSITLYTDGGFWKDTQIGGVGFIADFGSGFLQGHGFLLNATNQRAELMAALYALVSLAEKGVPSGTKIYLKSDSQYLIKGMNDWVGAWKLNGWRTATRAP